MAEATIDDLAKLDIRVGTVVAAHAFPETRQPASKLTVDLGAALGLRRSSAQLTALHAPEALVGRPALVVALPSRRIGRSTREVLCLGVPDAGGLIALAGPERPVPNGGTLS